MTRLGCCFILLAWMVGSLGATQADARVSRKNRISARKLVKKGRRALRKKKFKQALKHFIGAYKLDPNDGGSPWYNAYPALRSIMDNGIDEAREPMGNVFKGNIGWANEEFMHDGCWGGCGGFSYYAEVADNIEDADPCFVDEASLDLRLRPGSPAFTIPGFADIPFEKIGPYKAADFNIDGYVDLADFARLAAHWLLPRCNEPDWCERTDLNWDKTVDCHDLIRFSKDWLSQD